MSEESLEMAYNPEHQAATNAEKNRGIPADILAAATDGHTIEQVREGVHAATESAGQTKHSPEPEKTPEFTGSNTIDQAAKLDSQQSIPPDNIMPVNQVESSPQHVAA